MSLEPAQVVDEAAPRRVLVFGSPPGSGRDLDLLVRDSDRQTIEEALAAAGFHRLRDEWVRFANCTAESVELVPASEWKLPAAELGRLYENARPLNGYDQLVVPASEDSLLVLARIGSGALPEKRRPRIQAALAERPDGWEVARSRAGAWSLTRELERLERAYRRPRASSGGPRPRRPRVVALSGIDGSGKSSQAQALKAALERLGYDAVVEWSPFGQNAWLNVLGVPVKRALSRLRLRPAAPAAETGLERTSGTALREQSSAVNYAWSAVVTLANGLAQLRTIARHSRHGRIVVYDRYALDSTVQLRFRYGAGRSFRLQRLLIRMLSPKPVSAFYLAIPPEVSLDRKDDRWTRDDLAAQARLYDEELEASGVTQLDGLRPADELAAEIAEAVWRALG